MSATTTGRVTVIGRPGCVQCTATYRALDEASRVAPIATAEGDIQPKNGNRAAEVVSLVERSGADPGTGSCRVLHCFLR